MKIIFVFDVLNGFQAQFLDWINSHKEWTDEEKHPAFRSISLIEGKVRGEPGFKFLLIFTPFPKDANDSSKLKEKIDLVSKDIHQKWGKIFGVNYQIVNGSFKFLHEPELKKEPTGV